MKIIKFLYVQVKNIISLKKYNRNNLLVESEYDGRIWKNDLIRAQSTSSLNQYLFPNATGMLLMRTGKYFAELSNSQNFLEIKKNLLNQILEVNKHENILELGCGSGWNLAILRKSGFDGNLYGLDISKNAIETISTLNKKYNLSIFAEVTDLTNESILSHEFVKSADVIFSYLTLEQMPLTAESVVRRFASLANEKRIFFLESSSDLFPYHYSDFLTKIYTKKKNYLRNLKKIFIKTGIPVQIKRLHISHRIGNEIALWELSTD